MYSIVIDYNKCRDSIDSCTKPYQLKDCDNLIKNFETKHRKNETSWKRYKELLGHIKLRMKQIN